MSKNSGLICKLPHLERFKNIKTLEVAEGILCFIDFTGSLLSTSLEHLDMGGNSFRFVCFFFFLKAEVEIFIWRCITFLVTLSPQIGPEFEVFVNLRKLLLPRNKISKVIDNLCLPQLEELDVSYNELSELKYFPDNLPNLKRLRAVGNRITSIPMDFEYLSDLKELRLDANQIGYIPTSTLKAMPEYVF